MSQQPRNNELREMAGLDNNTSVILLILLAMFVLPILLPKLAHTLLAHLVSYGVLVPAAQAAFVLPATEVGLDPTRLAILALGFVAAIAGLNARRARTARATPP